MTTFGAPKMLLLLLKSDAKFAHTGKYALYGNPPRWHMLHADKPAPKNAPIAAVPHAAGQHLPATLTSDEVEQLKYPAEKAEKNHEMAAFNDKHLPELLGHAANGDATAILGMGLGTNSHAKKKAAIANYLLEKMGSPHKVSHGQAAGSHHAVQGDPAPAPEKAFATPEPVAPEPDANPEDAAPVADAAALSMPAFTGGTVGQSVIDYYEAVAQKVMALAVTGDAHGLEQMKLDGLKPNKKGKVSNTWAGKTPNSKLLLALHAQATEHSKGGKPSESKPADLPSAEAVTEPAASTGQAQPTPDEPAPAEQFDVTASGYLAGKDGYPQQYANKKQAYAKAEKLKAAGYDVHVSALHPFKIVVNSKPGSDQNPIKNEKPAAATVSEQPAAPEPAPIKKEPRLIIPKKAPEAPASTPVTGNNNLAQINWDGQKLPDSNKNAKSHNKQVEKIKGLAMAGDVAGLEALKFGTNTYGKKQELLKQTVIAALKESAPAAAPESVNDALQAVKDSWKKQVESGNANEVKQWLKTYEESNSSGDWDDLIAYGKQLLAGSAKPDDGPKEGDLKQGADGMLVLKDGHWVKVEEAKLAEQQAAASEPTGVHAVQIPDFGTISPGQWGTAYQKVAEALHEAVALHGAEGLKGKVINHADGTFTIKAAGYNLKKVGPDNQTNDLLAKARRAAMHAYVTQLKAAAGKPAKAKKQKATPAPQAATPAQTAPAMESMDTWQQTGPQGGSNPGGRFKDTDGHEWYCKFPADEDVAKSEVLAAKLYAALGISGQDAKLITKGGKVGIASKWTSVSKAPSPAALAKTEGVASGFGADAWLGNWDVVGLGFDNLQIGADGKAHRVDAGGSLMYRAQGGKKAFGNSVIEIDSLRDAKINPQAAAVFGGLTRADITASVAKVIKLPDSSIRAICHEHGPGDIAARKALAETLIARKADLAAKFPKAGKTSKKRLDSTNLPVDASQLPKRHDFSNWNGPGKGLSSQPHVNSANHAVEQEAFELAKTGNLTKLKDFHFHEIDKATGNATGKMIPIKNHPSKHVVQFHADLVQMLDEIANPPEPLKHFVETDVGTLDALAAAFPPKPFGTTVDSVKSNEKLGFWVVLGGASAVEKFKPKKVMDFTKTAIAAAYDKYKQAKPLAKHFINSVQASGSYNDLFRNGKEHDGHGNKLTDVAAAALEQATSQPEGTSIYRWQNMSDDMVKKIISAPDGSVFQATGPMCTSYSPTATSGFGQHRVTIRYANGAKAVESFGSGAFSGEKEITTLPNSRFVILSKQMVPNEKNPGKQRLELEVLMLPPDLGISGSIV